MDRSSAGWYPDPLQRRPYRWWDGAQWSAYVANQNQPAGGDVEWDPPEHSPSKEPVRPGVPSMATALSSFAIGVGLSYLAIVIMDHLGKPGGTAAELLVSELALWMPLIGGVVLVTTRRGSRSLVRDFDLAWRPVDIGFGFAGSLAARTLSSVIILPVVLLFPKLSSPDITLFRTLTTGANGWLVLVVVTCVGAPIVEELFFRGLIQTRLVGRFGPVAGIGATSVLFGAAHLIDWSGLATTSVYALSIAGAGVALGTIRHLTGRLGTSMMTHCWFNTQAMIALAVTNAHSFKI